MSTGHSDASSAGSVAGLTGGFPRIRMRRNRRDAWTRRMMAEFTLSPSDFIWPIFVMDGDGSREAIASMPGVDRLTIDYAVEAAVQARDLGIPAIALFPKTDPALKTKDAREAVNPDNLVCRAVRAVKAAVPDIGVLCDVALDPYNADGHDGLVEDGRILNDETVAVLCQQAVIQADAGCDIIGPSDMMDGRIGAIRDALDASSHENVLICSYAAKYASAFYGPFRDAIGSGGVLIGDKKTYQMDPANTDEAIRETALDLQEGADMVMVKPGMPYLDIVRRIAHTFAVPTAVYQVSGEYAMIKGAADRGWIDGEAAMMESLMAFKRAGADSILTYFALEAAKRLKEG
ncbi:MAG: porphobilinogen synthase [Rhodospirillaceae bacterium]